MCKVTIKKNVFKNTKKMALQNLYLIYVFVGNPYEKNQEVSVSGRYDNISEGKFATERLRSFYGLLCVCVCVCIFVCVILVIINISLYKSNRMSMCMCEI